MWQMVWQLIELINCFQLFNHSAIILLYFYPPNLKQMKQTAMRGQREKPPPFVSAEEVCKGWLWWSKHRAGNLILRLKPRFQKSKKWHKQKAPQRDQKIFNMIIGNGKYFWRKVGDKGGNADTSRFYSGAHGASFLKKYKQGTDIRICFLERELWRKHGGWAGVWEICEEDL